MQRLDVERIIRDVLNEHGLQVASWHVEQQVTGWRLTVRDVADRIVGTSLPDGPPAALRAALTRWIADSEI